MIPRVRTWRVRYHFADGDHQDIYVHTINRRFARWEARSNGGYGLWVHRDVTAETVSLIRDGVQP